MLLVVVTGRCDYLSILTLTHCLEVRFSFYCPCRNCSTVELFTNVDSSLPSPLMWGGWTSRPPESPSSLNHSVQFCTLNMGIFNKYINKLFFFFFLCERTILTGEDETHRNSVLFSVFWLFSGKQNREHKMALHFFTGTYYQWRSVPMFSRFFW